MSVLSFSNQKSFGTNATFIPYVSTITNYKTARLIRIQGFSLRVSGSAFSVERAGFRIEGLGHTTLASEDFEDFILPIRTKL